MQGASVVQEPGAAIGERVVGAAGGGGPEPARVAAFLDLIGVIADALAEVHVLVQGGGDFFAENNGLGGLTDCGFAHALGPLMVHVGGEVRGVQVGFEPVVPSVDQVTAGGGVRRVGGAGGGDLRFARADEDAHILVVGLEPGHPERRLARGKMAVVLIGVHVDREPELFEVIDAGDAFGGFLGVRKGGEQHRREDRNDGDDDEQFDEREGAVAARRFDGKLLFHNTHWATAEIRRHLKPEFRTDSERVWCESASTPDPDGREFIQPGF